MGKVAVARKLADELGMAFDEALRVVDDVGDNVADDVADNASTLGDDLMSKLKKAGIVGAGGAGAVGLYNWQMSENELQKIQSLSDVQEQKIELVKSVLSNKKMTPEEKINTLRQADESGVFSDISPSTATGSSSTSGSSLWDDPLKVAVALVIVAIVLSQALGGGE